MPTQKTQDHSNILVIKLGALGDFFQALGCMKAIRQHHSTAKITLLTSPPYVSIGSACPYFDDVLCDKRPKWFEILKLLSLRQTLLNVGFDRVYDLQNNDRTSMYFHLFPKSRKPEWVGSVAGASHANLSKTRTAGHALDGHIETLAFAGINKDSIDIDDLSWATSSKIYHEITQPYIIMAPGSAPTRTEKRWPASHYASLAKSLSRSHKIIILGTKGEKSLADTIKGQCPDAIDLTGKTDILDIPDLARTAAYAIGNDSGPMHIIAQTGCPSYILFSKHSDPAKHAPRGRKVITIQQDDLSVLKPEDLMEYIKSSI